MISLDDFEEEEYSVGEKCGKEGREDVMICQSKIRTGVNL